MEGSESLLRKVRAIGTIGSTSLLAMALLLVPTLAAGQRAPQQTRMNAPVSGRPLGAFTPAVSDPRLSAMLALGRGSETAGVKAPSGRPETGAFIRVC